MIQTRGIWNFFSLISEGLENIRWMEIREGNPKYDYITFESPSMMLISMEILTFKKKETHAIWNDAISDK